MANPVDKEHRRVGYKRRGRAEQATTVYPGGGLIFFCKNTTKEVVSFVLCPYFIFDTSGDFLPTLPSLDTTFITRHLHHQVSLLSHLFQNISLVFLNKNRFFKQPCFFSQSLLIDSLIRELGPDEHVMCAW